VQVATVQDEYFVTNRFAPRPLRAAVFAVADEALLLPGDEDFIAAYGDGEVRACLEEEDE
jgi:hypothetical protein